VTKEESLIKLFEDWAGEKALKFSPLPESGSYREYYRISGPGKVAIGAYNSDKKENRAFWMHRKFHRLSEYLLI